MRDGAGDEGHDDGRGGGEGLEAWGLSAPDASRPGWRLALARASHRVRHDAQLGAVMLFGGATLVALAPFAVFRLLNGDHAQGLLNLFVMSGVATVMAWAWRSASARRPALAATVFHTTVAVFMAWRFGHDVLMWMPPIVIGNFVLAGRGRATVVNLLALLALAGPGPHPALFSSVGQYGAFIASFLLVCMLSWVFATLTRHQRDQLEAQTLLDPMTGAFNRRALARELDLVQARHARLREPWGCLVLDLDHFKAVNDRFGHDVGDQVLVAFTRLVQQRTRPTDRLFRLGGEEFLLLVPGGDATSLAALGGKLCDAVRAGLPLPGVAVTVSVGVAMLGAGEAPRAWLARADAAAYRAKAEGRDRVAAADAPAG